MKIVVVGASGMAGSVISHYLKNRGHDVRGFARTKVNDYTDFSLDILNDISMCNFKLEVLGRETDVIINCIGLLVKACQDNPSMAIYINSYFPHVLENMTKNTSTKVIHLSTDCIFDGKSIVPYDEYSLPTERNWYGRSKALGEINNDKDLTLRQSIIGPAPQVNNTGLFNWLLTQKEKTIKGFDKVFWNGITTLELAKSIEKILVNTPQLSGIYSLLPKHIINKYELLMLIKNKWNFDVNIEKVSEPESFKILDSVRKEIFPILDYKEQIDELYDYMNKHNIKVCNFY